MRWPSWIAGILVGSVFLLQLPGMKGVAAETPPVLLPDTVVTAMLAETRAGSPVACANHDLLVKILCAGRIRIGLRTNYPQFGFKSGEKWEGFEVDLARLVADRLGVQAELVGVTPANRLALLAEGKIDLTIATMGHNTQRDTEARFVRPHYYQSETILVGPRQLRLRNWDDLAGRPVCVTVGNGSSAVLSAQGSRLLLFDHPTQLLEQLQSGSCSLVAQDNSFFEEVFDDPSFTDKYERKLGFAPVPWGMAVPRENGARLARVLGLLLQALHRDGQLVELAQTNQIDLSFLQAQQVVWNRADCNTADQAAVLGCLMEPLTIANPRTRFAAQVEAVEARINRTFGLRLVLPMLTSLAAWQELCAGTVNSLILVAGTIIATLAFACIFALARGVKRLRGVAWLFAIVLQSCPVVLALVIAQSATSAITPYSPIVALGTSIVTLGMINGVYAGQAISESADLLRARASAETIGRLALLRRAAHRSGRQIDSFMVNATKGTPAASFIGTPELLNALTDISSISSERISTYGLLLVFYTVMVMGVIRGCALLRRVMDVGRAIA
jgi:polar amino acid transport system substrate-binding protein